MERIRQILPAVFRRAVVPPPKVSAGTYVLVQDTCQDYGARSITNA